MLQPYSCCCDPYYVKSYFLLIVDLMGMLKWRDNPAGLEDHLKKFMRVEGEEIVKVSRQKLLKYFDISSYLSYVIIS